MVIFVLEIRMLVKTSKTFVLRGERTCGTCATHSFVFIIISVFFFIITSELVVENLKTVELLLPALFAL